MAGAAKFDCSSLRKIEVDDEDAACQIDDMFRAVALERTDRPFTMPPTILAAPR
jgi:hypothetical protein